MRINSLIKGLIQRCGYELNRLDRHADLPHDFDTLTRDIYPLVREFTMTSPERVQGLIQAVRYLAEHHINGAIVECGVWRGGSMMAVLHTLLRFNDTDRDIYLFDTFEGMVAPTEEDVSYHGKSATEKFEETRITADSSNWCKASLADVKTNIAGCAYPSNKIHFVKGRVEQTLFSQQLPEKIALLRLDTDWYESTKLGLEVLYPLLCSSGVLIIDDYGHWQGARKAVDDYLQGHQAKILLNRMDSTGRIAVKP